MTLLLPREATPPTRATHGALFGDLTTCGCEGCARVPYPDCACCGVPAVVALRCGPDWRGGGSAGFGRAGG